jgi:glycosyltransferase involved in cell wall biosynthesis
MSSTISIIIATYNAEKYLQHCLDSIIPQLDETIELIVIDGDSKDATVAIIKKNQQYISYFITEPDKGIYDAWNKGIKNATAEWIMFVGADDQLMPNALPIYNQFINDNAGAAAIDLISSRVQMIDENGTIIRTKGWSFLWPMFLKEMTIAHPGALHSKRLFEKYGDFNINYKIVGDYELLLRAGDSLKYLYLDTVTVVMSEGGASDSVKSIKEHYKAVTTTGKYPKHLALLNALLVYSKFKVKKLGRKIGLNLYLRKSYS